MDPTESKTTAKILVAKGSTVIAIRDMVDSVAMSVSTYLLSLWCLGLWINQECQWSFLLKWFKFDPIRDKYLYTL